MKGPLPTALCGGKSYPLTHALVQQLLQGPHTDPGLLAELAGHPSASVRATVAGNTDSPPEVLDALFAAAEHKVLAALLDNESFQRYGSYDTQSLWAVCERDAEHAQVVARRLESFAKADMRVLAGKLAKHPDPEVREALAGNYSAPRTALRSLLEDDDPVVAANARNSLVR